MAVLVQDGPAVIPLESVSVRDPVPAGLTHFALTTFMLSDGDAVNGELAWRPECLAANAIVELRTDGPRGCLSVGG